MIPLHSDHLARIQEVLVFPDKALHLAYRVLGVSFQMQTQERLAFHNCPTVFVHGNPHLDNYARYINGAGMVDFDRSRMGPFCWDVSRFWGSLLIKSKYPDSFGVEVTSAFCDAYAEHLLHPEREYPAPEFVALAEAKSWQENLRTYVAADKKWANKLRRGAVPTDNPLLLTLLRGYLKARDEHHLLDTHRIKEMGKTPGSLGKTHYLYLLECKSNRDLMMFDLKETYTDSDSEYFYSPVPHHGLRMILASNLYAPGLEQRLGHFTVNEVQYWGREIQSFQVKFKRPLNKRKQVALATSVGAQLGRAHRLSLVDVKPAEVIAYLHHYQHQILEHSKWMVEQAEVVVEELRKNATSLELSSTNTHTSSSKNTLRIK